MNIEGLQALQNISFLPAQSEIAAGEQESSFEHIFQAALDVWNETNMYQVTADKTQLDFITGKSDNILSVMMAQEKAYTALNFTIQVTNKVIEAYREIMRMQI